MSKLLLIDLGSGNLNDGLSMVTVQFWKSQDTIFTQFKVSLPAQPTLINLYRDWKLLYDALHQRLAWKSRIKFLDTNSTNVSQESFDDLCLQLRVVFNGWLNADIFVKVLQALEKELVEDDEVQVQLHPMESQRYLPRDITLALVADNHDVLIGITSRHSDNFIQISKF